MEKMNLLKVWPATSGWKRFGDRWMRGGADRDLDIRPVTAAIRMKTPIHVGGVGPVPTYRMLWLSQDRERRPLKAMESVLIPN